MGLKYVKIKGGYRVEGESPFSVLRIPKRHWFRKVLSVGRIEGEVCFLFIPEGVLSIEESAFEDHTELERVILPTSIISIGKKAFKGCTNIEEVDAKFSMLSILGAAAFEGCSGLRFVELPEYLASIGARAFKDCVSLTKFCNPINNKVIESKTFYGCSNLVEFEAGTYVTIADDALKGTKYEEVVM